MRLFVAIEISVAIRNAVELRVETIRGRLPAASWLKPEALHLTVCRIRSRWRQEDTEAFVHAFEDLGASPFEVREIVLFSSELRQSGAVHNILHRLPLSSGH